jgi:hypothetical protein
MGDGSGHRKLRTHAVVNATPAAASRTRTRPKISERDRKRKGAGSRARVYDGSSVLLPHRYRTRLVRICVMLRVASFDLFVHPSEYGGGVLDLLAPSGPYAVGVPAQVAEVDGELLVTLFTPALLGRTPCTTSALPWTVRRVPCATRSKCRSRSPGEPGAASWTR